MYVEAGFENTLWQCTRIYVGNFIYQYEFSALLMPNWNPVNEGRYTEEEIKCVKTV